jgi:hypothetical protein
LFPSFPGILPKDDILGLLKLMTCKSPMDYLTAKIALEGGYDPCSKFTGNEKFWSENVGCDPGFVPDEANGYCYKVMPTLENMNNGEKQCKFNYDAEMVLFNSNSEVKGLINLLHKGTH